jgi:hypothetical protein
MQGYANPVGQEALAVHAQVGCADEGEGDAPVIGQALAQLEADHVTIFLDVLELLADDNVLVEHRLDLRSEVVCRKGLHGILRN